MNKLRNFSTIITCVLLFFSCTAPSTKSTDKKTIVCTTGIIGNVVQQVVGDKYEVLSLMGPGVDPHLYKASQGDVEKLTNAHIIIYNGLHLEGKMAEILERLAKQKQVWAMSDANDANQYLPTNVTNDLPDPHFWFDTDLWLNGLAQITRNLSQIDTLHAGIFNENFKTFQAKVNAEAVSIENMLAEIPEENRTLVTSHDAFQYFSRKFDIDVLALQGLSTVSETSLKEINKAVDYVCEHGIKTIFIETSVSPHSIKAVVEGCKSRGVDVAIGKELFSDAMGADGTPEGTYIGMLKHNAEAISQGLK